MNPHAILKAQMQDISCIRSRTIRERQRCQEAPRFPLVHSARFAAVQEIAIRQCGQILYLKVVLPLY